MADDKLVTFVVDPKPATATPKKELVERLEAAPRRPSLEEINAKLAAAEQRKKDVEHGKVSKAIQEMCHVVEVKERATEHEVLGALETATKIERKMERAEWLRMQQAEEKASRAHTEVARAHMVADIGKMQEISFAAETQADLEEKEEVAGLQRASHMEETRRRLHEHDVHGGEVRARRRSLEACTEPMVSTNQ
eukprot:comp18445_c0_seq1/m.19721 comp18445_c0_seq1/g.19721  ORF comp18445_c0_seq1/g.19721 comp18445_c0_seq1/m.19721 type:complete len:194 (-) comp18445_c0_seq1:2-583(-)